MALVIDQIVKKENFTSAEKQLAGFIMANHQEIMNMSLVQLAGAAYVSKSTIIRFCKKLGCRGHKELCVELARELNNFFTVDDQELSGETISLDDDPAKAAERLLVTCFRTMTAAVKDVSLNDLAKAASLIAASRDMIITAGGNALGAGVDLQAKLLSLRKRIFFARGIEEILRYGSAAGGDACLIIVGSPVQALLTGEDMRRAKITGMSVVMIGLDAGASEAVYADYALTARQEGNAVEEDDIVKSVTLFFLTNLLYVNIFIRDYEKNFPPSGKGGYDEKTY